MRLVLAVLAVGFWASVPAAKADSIRDYDHRGLSRPLEVRIGSSHEVLRDVMRSWRREVSDISMFDKSDRHDQRFFSWRREHKDVPKVRVSEPATLLLVSAGVLGMIGAYRLLRV
jgi:hypothetical protein